VAMESTVQREILSQPDVWSATWERLQESREALDSLLFSACWDALFFTGCGSTHYLSLAAANLHQSLTGQRTRGVPASEIAFFPTGVYPDIPDQRTLLVAISRSGWTTETLRAVQRQHERALPVLAITCHGDSQLARESEAVLALDQAREESVPQTRSFTSMYLAAQYVAGVVAADAGYLAALEQLPGFAGQVLSESAATMEEVGGIDWGRVIFLGSGPYYGLACEAMLKLKEMALSWSEAYHFAEFRHGPISLVDGNSLIVGLLSDTAGDAERALLSDVRGLGGQTLAIGAHPPGPDAATYSVSLTPSLPELARGALYLLPLQLLAYHHAIMRGADPDRPRHLQQTVMLEGI
jgi:glucosamine--fructose-6-phosphate aminotransferase (isomerizing)